MTTEEAAKAVVERIIASIECDLNDRRGLHLSDLDDDTLDDIKETLAWTYRSPTHRPVRLAVEVRKELSPN